MLIKVLFILAAAYIIVLTLVVIASNRLIFLPPAPGYKDSEPGIFKISLRDGSEITCIYLHNPEAKYTLLYSHGNAEDLGTVQHRLADYLEAGFSVFAYDYPGYGTSEGRPSETIVYESIFAAYSYLTNNLAVPAANIIAYGFSVGCGPSIELATKKPVAGIVLQSPFLSAFRVATYVKVFPWDVFDNYKKIAYITAPVLIYHGTDDEITPAYHSRTLWKKAPEPKTYIETAQGDHNNFIQLAGQEYWDALRQFVNSL